MGILKVVRHAQSMSNNHHPGVTVDRHNYLTKTGINQAIDLGEQLVNEGFVPDIIWSSTIPRAYQTSMILLSIMNHPCEIGLSDNIAEMKWNPNGEYITEDKMKILFGADHIDNISKKLDHYAHPEGERQIDVYNRVSGFFETHIRQLLKDNKNVIIVCHYFVVRALVSHIETNSANQMTSISPKNCSPFTFEIN